MSSPSPGDIVWLNLQSPRPALVLQVDELDNHEGALIVHVWPGTCHHDKIAGVLVKPDAERPISGLSFPTRFQAERLALPWIDRYFADAPDQAGPVMGLLHPRLVAQVMALLSATTQFS